MKAICIKKRSLLLIVSVLQVLLFAGCRHERPVPEVMPLLKTDQITVDKDVNGGINLSAEFILSGSYRSIEYGFSLDTMGNFSNPIIIPVGTDHEPSKFAITAQVALRPGITYYVRAYAKTTNYKVSGNTLTFNSTGSANPVIDKIIPAEALWGDTVLIIGKNFDYYGKDNIVKFNDITTAKSWGTRDTIQAIVPFVSDIQNYNMNVSVNVYNNITQVGSPLKIAEPVITGISTTEGQYPDTVIVAGKNFSPFGTQLLVNGVPDSIMVRGKDSFYFIVPYLKSEQIVTIDLLNLNKTYPITSNFHYHGQQIVLPQKEAWIGDTLKLYGTNVDFRRIMLEIVNTDPALILYGSHSLTVVQAWNDSLSFILNGSFPTSAFNLDVRFGHKIPDFPYKAYFVADQLVIKHKNPVIVSLPNNEVSYRQGVNMISKGTYIQAGNQGVLVTSLDGSIRLSFEGAGGGVPGDEQIIPGDYQVQVYSFNRYSNPAFFTVKSPAITNVSTGLIDRDHPIQVTGTNLPYYTDYQISSVRNGTTFSLKNAMDGSSTPTSQKIDLASVFGKGDYQLQVNIQGKAYKYPGTFAFQDYFTFAKKTTNPVPFASSIGCGFTLNNKLYIPQNSGMSIIDLETGAVSTRDRSYNYDHQPVFLDNKVYLNIISGGKDVIASFNDVTEDWDVVNMDGVSADFSLVGFGVFNNHLLAISNNGDIYQYDQKWTFLSNVHLDLFYVHYIHSGNGVLYFCDFYKGIIDVVSTTDWKITRQILLPASYQNSLRYIFEIDDEMYFLGEPTGSGSNWYNFYKFTSGEAFEKLSPFHLTYDYYYHFCPDGKGNVYFVNQGNIYKFNL